MWNKDYPRGDNLREHRMICAHIHTPKVSFLSIMLVGACIHVRINYFGTLSSFWNLFSHWIKRTSTQYIRTHQSFLLRWPSSKAALFYSFNGNISSPPFSVINSPKSTRTQFPQLFKIFILYNLLWHPQVANKITLQMKTKQQIPENNQKKEKQKIKTLVQKVWYGIKNGKHNKITG